MKKTFITALAAAVLAALLAATASAKTYVLDFTSEKSGNVTEAYTEENGEFRLSAGKSPKAAISTLDGLEFQFRIDEAADWGLITVVTQSKYNETGLNGRGLKFRIGGEKGVEHRLPVLPEERPQLLRHGEDELAVGHLEAFGGDLGAPGVPVFLPAAWAHPRVAGEPHHVEIAAFRAFVVDVAVGEVAASDEALDRLDEAGPGEQAGVFLLEGGPRRLDYVLD